MRSHLQGGKIEYASAAPDLQRKAREGLPEFNVGIRGRIVLKFDSAESADGPHHANVSI